MSTDPQLQIASLQNSVQIHDESIKALQAAAGELKTGLQAAASATKVEFDYIKEEVSNNLVKASEQMNRLEAWLKATSEQGARHEVQVKTLSETVKDLGVRMDAMTASAKSTSPSTKPKDDNLMCKKDGQTLRKYGNLSGPNFLDWKFDVTNFMEQHDKTLVSLVAWIESQKTMEDITEARLNDWALQDAAIDDERLDWALDQLYYLLTVKTVELPHDQVQNLQTSGKMRGALAWKQVQSTAVGLTDNRLQHLTNVVTNPIRVKTYEEVPGAVAAWDRDVRELERFPESKLSETQKMACIRRLVPEALEENIMSQANNLTTMHSLRQYIEGQVALRRSAKPAAIGKGPLGGKAFSPSTPAASSSPTTM